MNKADVMQSIRNIRSVYKRILQADYVSDDENSVSWRNYSPGINRSSPYIVDYRNLLDRQQYSLLFMDNSFVQFYFKFDDRNNLNAAKLGYYPVPINSSLTVAQLYDEFDDANDWLVDMLVEQIGAFSADDNVSNTSHLRFDFDSGASSHYKAHLQFGGVNEFRLSSEKVPLPFSFVDMVVKCFMKETWTAESTTRQHQESTAFDLARFFHSEEKAKDSLFITCVNS